jgi:uncharacterized protein YidB (DUF937 family)
MLESLTYTHTNLRVGGGGGTTTSWVEAGQNTSTIALQVTEGDDEKGT